MRQSSVVVPTTAHIEGINVLHTVLDFSQDRMCLIFHSMRASGERQTGFLGHLNINSCIDVVSWKYSKVSTKAELLNGCVNVSLKITDEKVNSFAESPLK